MNDDVLNYYHRELAHLRKQAVHFADAHPKIAGRLRLGQDGSEDPHVERLLQGFAYLTARIRHKLDDEFPEITTGMLQVLYPHYLAPIPSCAIVELGLDAGQNELVVGYQVPRGQSLETDSIQGEPCRFRTAYPVTLWPIEVKQATLTAAPFVAPPITKAKHAAAGLRIALSCKASTVKFASLKMTRLRFFLSGQTQHVYRLQELLFNHAVEVAFAKKSDDREAVRAGPECIKAVGFERDEGMFPYPARSLPGYRLLTEFFTFPAKFLFIDIEIPTRALARIDRQLELYFYLNRSIPELEPHVTADLFRIGCSPIVNLYSQPAEPVRLSPTDHEYRVVPDVRRPLAHEIFSIDRVAIHETSGKSTECPAYFSIQHGNIAPGTSGPFWYGSRRASDAAAAHGSPTVDRGTEIHLALVNWDFLPKPTGESTMHVETTCLNRDLPARLPFGGGQPRLQFSEGGGVVTLIRCLTPPTPTFRPSMGRETLWRLVSHLTLNHLSISEEADGATALRNLFLFASVLERFLALFATVNSFTRLVARLIRRQDEYHRWPARIGDQGVL
ncbi:MAG: type VI secretion system baseplate subunit TssF [Planctomycetes bacterium]|nr:type VI secretion system baseplate subunit TssF [Planctomycetota bacterium]